ncbi:MAG: DNA polymerase III subunit gamma/tau [Thermoproteota archaeon]
MSSHLVLTRKWRPQRFEEVIGQNHIVRVLQNAVRTGRIAHAYLFSGPRGVGKTSVARILAKALNCEKAPTPEPCRICSRCKDITAGKHPDVLEIDGASYRGVDSIRSLRESIGHKPIKGRFKVYVIDEAHMLTTEAFNVLLRILEEPPSHVCFILTTTEIYQIPTAVLGRCQHLDFRRIPTKEISSHLKKIALTEGVFLPPSVLDAIAVEADGSLRDAQTFLEQVIAFQTENMNDDDILKLLGIVDRSVLFNTLKAVMEKDKKNCLRLAQEVYESGYSEVKFLTKLLDVVHQSLIIQKNPKASEHNLLFLKDLGKKSSKTLELYYQILVHGIELAKKSPQPYFVLEMTLLKLAEVPDVVMMPDLLSELKKTANSYVVPPDSFKTPSNITSRWDEFLDRLASQDPILHAQLVKSSIRYDRESNKIAVSVLPVYAEILRKDSTRRRLTTAIEQFFGVKTPDIVIEDGENIVQNQGKELRLEEKIENNPVIREILEIFNGSIIGVRLTHP